LALERTNVVDILGVERATGHVTLTIADELEWANEREHLLLLQDKINAYLRFIESGELLEACPAAQGRKAVIQVLTLHPLTEAAIQFLERARVAVEEAGIGFRYAHRGMK
jgi:uncharacterized protein DUF6572